MKFLFLLLSMLVATSALAQCPYPDISPPAQVTNLWVYLTGHRTFTVKWTSTGDDGSVGNPTNYEIRTSSSTITESNWCSATLHSTSSAAPNGQENCVGFVIPAGSCSSPLYVAVFCLDERGNRSPLSNVVAGSWWCGTPYTMVECY